MASIRCIILLCALFAAFVVCGPTPTKTLRKRSFAIPRIKRDVGPRSHQWNRRASQRAMRKVFRKYNFPIEERANVGANQPGANDAGEVTAAPEENAAEFLSPVTIGGQQLHLDFDTGSSDLWVFSTELSRRTIGQHNAYDATKSQTFTQQKGSTFLISYGDGSGAAGIVGVDTVDIGGATVTEQAVEMATAISQSFIQDTNNDGLVGLAFGKLNTVKPQRVKTFFENLMPLLDMPVFTADLTNDSSGTYEFGRIDSTKFKGNLTNVPVNTTSGFWQIESKSFSINGKVTQRPNGNPAIADTGTSLMLVDNAVATAYYNAVPQAQNDPNTGGFVYPCNTKLPDFGVAMGPYMAIIPGNQVTFAQVDTKTCFGGIQSNGGSNLQIYGDVMFKAQFVVFDGGNAQLSVAPKN